MTLFEWRQACRSFRRWPASTAASIVILAVGIGTTTAIFSAVNGVLLRPLDYAEPSRLAVVLDDGQFPVAGANCNDLRAQVRSFESLHAAEAWGPNITGGDRAEQLPGVRVTAGMFEALGVSPRIGRAPGAAAERGVLLSHRLWVRRFGADPTIVGRDVTLDGSTYTISGVMPESFQFPPFWIVNAELWGTLDLTHATRGGRSLRLFGRLRDGVSVEQAGAEVAAISGRLAAAFPTENRRLNLMTTPLHEMVTGKVRLMFQALLAASALLLLVVCANVANLLLVRATGRAKEMAIRAAVGAGRAAIVRQMLVESFALAAAGGIAGVGVAYWGVRAIATFSPADVPRGAAIALDPFALVFAAAVALAAGLLFGLAPALRASKVDLNSALRDETAGSTGARDGGRSRAWLISAEAALAVVLTIGAALMVRSFQRLTAIDAGFDPQNLLTLTVSVTGTAMSPEGARLGFYDRVRERIAALPGVTGASWVNHVPMAGDQWGLRVSTPDDPREGASAVFRVADAGYFGVMRIPIEDGREFSTFDTQSAPAVAMVNRTMARHRWPGQSAVGKRIRVGRDGTWMTVAGVVADVKQSALAGEPADEVYLPLRQSPTYLGGPQPHVSYLSLAVRTTGDPLAIANAVRAAIGELEPNAPVSQIQPMEAVIAAQLARPRFLTLLIGAFGSAALLLAAIGIYGVVSYSTARRTREIGIRMAIGATRGRIAGMIVRQTLRTVVPGIAIGLAVAFAAARSAAGLLYGVTAGDPLTFGAVAAGFGLLAIAAAMIPAQRAARIDPSAALRGE